MRRALAALAVMAALAAGMAAISGGSDTYFDAQRQPVGHQNIGF